MNFTKVSETETLVQNINLFKKLVILSSKEEDLKKEIVEYILRGYNLYGWLDGYEDGFNLEYLRRY